MDSIHQSHENVGSARRAKEKRSPSTANASVVKHQNYRGKNSRETSPNRKMASKAPIHVSKIEKTYGGKRKQPNGMATNEDLRFSS